MRGRLAAALAPLTLIASVALAAPSEYRPAPSGCSSLGEGTQPVHVTWSHPTSSPGCFFFSGPFELGRDTQLGSVAEVTRRAGAMAMRFGAAVFEGSARGPRVALTRRSEHTHGGVWIVNEYIEGELTSIRRGGESCQGLRARYRYEECLQRTRCSGGCTISATLEVVGR